MSRSWSDELEVALGPARVSLARIGRKWTWRGLERSMRERLEVVPAGGGAIRWRPALDALESALAALARPVGPLTVQLSNAFVRHAVVPWSDALDGADEDAAYARQCFGDLYGDTDGPWELRLSAGRIGAPRLASAVDRDLLAALRDTCARARVTLRSVQPHLMAACNAVRRQLRRRTGWVVVPESGSVCVALLQQGDWVRLRTARLGPSWRHELPPLLDREALMVDTDVPRDVVLVATDVDPADFAAGEWTFEVLSPDLPGRRVPDASAIPAVARGG